MQWNVRGVASQASHDFGASAPDFTSTGEIGEKESCEGAGWRGVNGRGAEKENREDDGYV
jgi:hypothetical protein